ncbi:23401_t:CDS:10 [Gigaspora margarita]|uniref:23401_t:CDS:1 n=1 Tax=Gigaspora margarita TaxID=4874 RepID=A0ABN7UM86_GIGMA|nr:23401_t:CDS:10 [Gigaspora margarita]
MTIPTYSIAFFVPVKVPDPKIRPDSEARLDPLPAPTSIQNIPLSENLTPISDLILFDKNIPTYYPNMSNVLVVDLLIGNILDIKAESSSNTNIKQKKNQFLMIDELIKWLSKPEIKNNKKIRSKSVPKTDKEWFDLMESYISEPSNPKPQAYYFLDLDIEVPWPVPFPENEEHREVWQNGIQYAKDMFKNSEYLIRVKFIRANTVILDKETKRGFKIIDKYESIRESKKAGGKYIRGGPNVILTKKMKPGFWVEIDEKFLVRDVKVQSEVERLDSNAVVYGLYQIRKPDVNRLMPIKDGTLNCVAERVIEHFDQAKRGYGLTKIRRQKINDWEKKMRIPGARVHDIAELEKILKHPITLLDITYKAINNALQGSQAIWLMEVGDRTQRISQFVLEDENIINEEKRSILLESLKVVDLAEQVFGANHAGSRLANEINEWYPISEKINNNIKRACVEHGHGQEEYAPWFNQFGYPTYHLVQVAVNGKLPKDDITGFAQVRSFKFAPNIHPVIPVWYGKHFACQGRDGCIKEKGWAPIVLLQYLLGAGILEDLTVREVIISLTKQTKVWLLNNQDISCVIIDKFIQGSKIDEKRLTHQLVTDEDELNFLIKDCTDAGTFAGREKCPLGFILTYYEGYQPQYTHLRASMLAYAHINLLEMLRRFEPNEVVRIATDSIYVRKEALYKIENVPAFFKQEKAKDPDLCPHTYPLCAMCTDPEEFFISKSEYAKWIKEFLKTKMPLVKNDYKRHKLYICRFCFGEWFYRPDSYALLHQLEEQEIREIQPGQWRDKSEKIYGPNADIVYWPKNRHWESIKDITESTAPSIHDPITRFRVSYLNGGGDINMVVFTHTNVLAKDFQNDRKVKAQTWHSFFRWNGVGEWTPERMRKKKFPRVVIWDEPPPFFGEMPHDWLKERADYYEESDLFREALLVAKKCEYLESEWKLSDRILSAHILSRRIAFQKCLELHRKKYPNVLIPLIYRPRDGRKQNCFVQIPGSSEKKELVKNDIIHLPLNTLPDKFLQGMLEKEKAIDWELGYAMTIHTSQGMTFKAPQRVWVINEHLAWDNLIYFAVGRVEYLGQLIRIEDKKKGREFNLSVDYILVLKDLQKNKCELCFNEMLWEWDKAGNPNQWTVDRIDNKLDHIEENICLVCLECNQNHRV